MRRVSLQPFIASSRVEMTFDAKDVKRRVFKSEVDRISGDVNLEGFMSNRIPMYYRAPDKIKAELENGGFFLQTVANTLGRLPTSEDFRNSHFGELLAAEFATAAMGLRLLYSKLELLTAENSNAFKMDVVMYDPAPEPIELVLLEVKSSWAGVKTDGKPAAHDKSIYADLFNSMNKYAKQSLRYDLTAAKDQLPSVPEPDRARLAAQLGLYQGPRIRHAGVCSIDLATHTDDEAALLATRRNQKDFEVDLVCVAEFAQVIDATWAKLDLIIEALR